MGEYGLVIAQGVAKLRAVLPQILEDGDNALPALAPEGFADLQERLRGCDGRIGDYGVSHRCAGVRQ